MQGLKYSGCSAALPIELVMVVSCFGGLAITLPPPISSPTLFSEVSGHGRLTNTDANTDKNTSTNTETYSPNSVLGIHSHPSKQKDNKGTYYDWSTFCRNVSVSVLNVK